MRIPGLELGFARRGCESTACLHFLVAPDGSDHHDQQRCGGLEQWVGWGSRKPSRPGSLGHRSCVRLQQRGDAAATETLSFLGTPTGSNESDPGFACEAFHGRISPFNLPCAPLFQACSRRGRGAGRGAGRSAGRSATRRRWPFFFVSTSQETIGRGPERARDKACWENAGRSSELLGQAGQVAK
ncbi:hypothetical protein VTN02DRAFT_1814 [Thermoascus thermophilus]